ncbi:alkene reductase [Methylobacterium oryzihabitans]|uniref:Alkene reductase n=1 Tax=Methylobacterium oryzihabitans TaxID=2499852 RepID=A0A437P9M6_9HYPH|nr:alkene reductase [Methylobacterium oryzihabitans]RVU18808.1 alkene reductase [Methylobacterium oryzihabitans]
MTTDALFQPLRLGALSLGHRVVMAPLTRMRSRQPGDVPRPLNAEYYGQRASRGGLLIAEATDIRDDARGYPGAPGIYTPDQIAGWRGVADAVHAKGGFLFVQIWHCGRISHSSMKPDGALPIAPSAVAAPGNHMDATFRPVPFETPRALEESEIPGLVAAFRQAALNAREAGADGVELHAANGYLIDQFLQDSTNRRQDRYGGSIANRARFLLEVVDAVAGAIGADRVGVRVSPWGSFNGMRDSDPGALFDHVTTELGRRGLAYLHLVEPRADQSSDTNAIDPDAPDAASRFKARFGGPLIAAGGFTPESAAAAIEGGNVDAVAFGRLFIANPDLPERIRRAAPFNRYDRATFYGGDARGYVDYPTLEAAE